MFSVSEFCSVFVQSLCTVEPAYSSHSKSGCYRKVAYIHRLKCTLQTFLGLGNLAAVERWPIYTG